MFIASLSSTVLPSSVVWFVDSGASRHMIGVKEQFTQFSKKELNLEVELGDNRIVSVVGVGTISFQRESLPPLKVKEVLYVLGPKNNLISVSIIEDQGYEVTFRRGKAIVYPIGGSIDSGKVIGVRHGRLYRFAFHPLRALMSSVSDGTTDNRDLCELWHRRMAHLHHVALLILREIVIGVPEFSIEHDEVCRGCAMGNYVKAPFLSRDNRAIGILDLIHTDVSGRFSYISLGGYEYYITFIDD